LVLPLIILGVIVIGGGVAIWKGSNTISPAIYRIFTSKEKRELDYKKEQQNFTVSKRGFWNNTYAFIFGEEAYAQTFNDKAPSQKILTGEEKQTTSQNNYSKFTNKRATRYTDG